MIERDNELKEAMLVSGILPPDKITWDGKLHRFPHAGGKKNGWYTAHPDGIPAAGFGCWKLGVKERWRASNGVKKEDFSPEDWAKMKEEEAAKVAAREAEEEAKWAKAAILCQKKWDEAMDPLPEHPYLVRKGIRDPEGIKQDKAGNLLIPMKSPKPGGHLASLQIIDQKGVKKFHPGGKAAGARFSIGADVFDKKGTVVVTEGWATGVSIHEATQLPVVVAFSAGNLMAVARYLQVKFKEVKIIVAADNDRWSKCAKGNNPGVLYANEAAGGASGLMVVPDFEDLESRPTDFNDLMLLEGPEKVRYWMDPDNVLKSTTAPPIPVELEPGYQHDESWGKDLLEEIIEGAPDPESRSWEDTAGFKCLGYDHETYFYMPRRFGQIKEIAGKGHTALALMQMADLSWWEMAFPGKGRDSKVDWMGAANALFGAQAKRGVFVKTNLRGRGCWNVEDNEGNRGVVLHLGDRLLAPWAKSYVDPEDYDCPEGRVYERKARLAGPSKTRAMDLDEALKVKGLFQDLLWHDEASGLLLAGWTVLAPLGGALPWRPHVWITGGAGSGKSTVLEKLVHPLLGDMAFYFDGGSTEAGIRAKIRVCALPVLYDEAEKGGPKSESRLASILDLVRSASSTSQSAETTKGTVSGEANSYHIRGMFCLASIGGALSKESDRQRISLLQMRSKSNMKAGEKDTHWRGYEPRLTFIDHNRGRELIARTLGWLRDGRLAETLRIFKSAAGASMGDARFGDQYGTLYAGAWTLMADEPPENEMVAREMLGSGSLDTFVEDHEAEGVIALRMLLQVEERFDTSNGMKTMTVGTLVGIALGDASLGVTAAEADQKLRQIGLKTQILDGQRALQVAHGSNWIKNALQKTAYVDIGQCLRTLPGTKKTGAVKFYMGFSSRTTIVPLDLLD